MRFKHLVVAVLVALSLVALVVYQVPGTFDTKLTPDERIALEEEWRAFLKLKGAETDETDRNLHVTSITIKGPEAADAFFVELRKLPHVKTLVVRGGPDGVDPTKVTDAAFEHIGTLAKLETLDAGGLQLGDTACTHLGKLSNLRALRLADSFITDNGVKHLKGLGRLEVLDLAGTDVGGMGLAELAGLKGLHTLDLRGTKLGTDDLKGVGLLTSLRVLHLPDVETQEGTPVHPIYDFPGGSPRPSTRVEGNYKPLKARNMSYLNGLPHLAGLVELENVAMTKVFREAGADRTLNSRPWDECPLGDDPAGMKVFFVGRIFKVTHGEVLTAFGVKGRKPTGELDLNNVASERVTIRERHPGFYHLLSRPSGKTLEYIKGYRNVTSLDLSNFMLRDDDMKVLGGFEKLEGLDLSGSPITGRGLALLKSLPNLKYLNLRGTSIRDEDLQVIRQMKALRLVVLSQTRVTEEGTDVFERGRLKAVFDAKQERPWWCNIDWDAELEKLSR